MSFAWLTYTHCQSLCICPLCSSLPLNATWHVLHVKGCVVAVAVVVIVDAMLSCSWSCVLPIGSRCCWTTTKGYRDAGIRSGAKDWVAPKEVQKLFDNEDDACGEGRGRQTLFENSVAQPHLVHAMRTASGCLTLDFLPVELVRQCSLEQRSQR